MNYLYNLSPDHRCQEYILLRISDILHLSILAKLKMSLFLVLPSLTFKHGKKKKSINSDQTNVACIFL